ncbi:hypothetical protein ACFOZY_02725 [Chungangia koreensis]|uniref:Peptidyl-prolyl cis-trans isomerase n=1 Tax=Chungangia koreensis TaxID=752657 RepID=A0ABV8X0Q7_9LACT
MEFIIPIKGAVNYKITLDSSVWIFDDRRIDLNTYFNTERNELDEDLEYTKVTSAHWSREIMEGATFPPTLKSEKKFEKTKMMTGTFGIHLKHFIKNSEPHPDASELVFESEAGDVFSIPFEEVDKIILKFSQEGKPLKEDGPIHVLLEDGSNYESPYKNISAIRIQ